MKKQTFPKIKTKLPGPKAAKIIKIDNEYVSSSYTRDFPCVCERGEGVKIIDVDGNQFLDFCAGIAVNATGHCHPAVVKAIKAQADKLIHMSGTDFYYEPQAMLAKKLATLAPGKTKKKVFFCNSGAEAVEAAIKLARFKTRRPRLMAYVGAFHGRTIGALTLTGSKVIQKQGFAPLMQGVTHVPYPNCYRCPLNLKYPSCKIECFDYIEKVLFKRTLPPDEVAAIFIEPLQGEGGYIVPPKEYMKRLQAMCQEHGILMVVDEIQSGMGRTGKMFCSEHYGIEPDIMCLAKGIASGMPLGAIVAKASIMDWPPGSHASTFGGNPIACAASLKTIELLEKGLVKNAASMGKYLIQKLSRLKKKYSFVGDVRGRGLMVGMEIITDKKTKNMAPKLRDKIVERAFYEGMIILGCGPNVIRFAPALTVTKKDVDLCVELLEKVFKRMKKR